MIRARSFAVTTEAIQSAIILSPREEVREAVRQELKALGAQNVLAPSGQDECIEAMILHADAVLVVDWELGSEQVNQVLAAAKGHHRVETRPIFMVIPSFDAGILATAADYGVLQLHAGPISRLAIRECLEALLEEDEQTRAIRETLVRVAEHRARGEWSVASGVLADLYDRMPDQERLALELADNLIHDGAWDQAATILEPYAKKTPPSIRALHLLGRCKLHDGDAEGAIDLLTRAKVLNPHNVDRLIDLGNAFLHNDQVDEARQEFRAALELDDGNRLAKIGESQCLLMGGEVNEALRLMKTISGPREMASIFNTTAVLAMRAGRFEKGMSLYKSALAALGKDRQLAARLLFNVGLGYRRWRKSDKALHYFEKSLELDPTYAKAKRHLAELEAQASKPPHPFDEEAIGRAATALPRAAGDGFAEGEESSAELTPLDWEPDD